MNIQYGPILRWPGNLRQRHERIRAPFKSGYGDTMGLLERELRKVNAESPVVQLALPPGAFRRSDGRPYADAEPEHPGVIVSFRKVIHGPGRTAAERMATERRVPLSFPADRFTHWEANLRAVAIALEDLRRIDRYGVTQNAEQYLGFKSLPPPGPSHDEITTVEDAARFLVEVSGTHAPPVLIIKSVGDYRATYRAAAARLHPDANPAAASDWGKLQAAKAMLDEIHSTAPN